MAVLKRDEFLTTLHGLIGDNQSDDAIKALENLEDTYNDMETKLSESGNGFWEQRYRENDEAWRKKYTNRFFSNPAYNNANSLETEQEISEREKAETVQINDLFSEK